MKSGLYWIDSGWRGRLAIIGRPRAGDWLDDEIAGWKVAGIDVVINLLENGEIIELGLQREAEICAARGIELVSYPIADRGVPASRLEAAGLCRDAAQRIRAGQSIGFHCRAGIGRSAVMAACTLISLGVDSNQALADLRKARGVDVPDTRGQLDWISAFSQNDDAAKAMRERVFR